jgi:hypothetical protein
MKRNSLFVLAASGRRMMATLLALVLCGAALASEDPPGRVARVNLLDGRGAVQPAGTDSWVGDLINRPLTGGDKLWIESGSRAEMHIGSTALRLGAGTALQILLIDDSQVRLRVTAGSVSVRVRALDADERFDIETPAGEISILRAGGYRLDVDDHEERGRFAAWSGLAEVRGDSGSRRVASDESAVLVGGDEPSIGLAAAGTTDSLDLWAEDRDRREDESRSARYVSRDVVGYEELDGYGEWTVDPVYGSVWIPQVVAVDWAPYRFGYWDWIGPWGWTWIDDAPWGFAPCHYGRWVHVRHGWGWVPGARDWHRPVFAPALVAWRGDRYPAREPGSEHGPRVGWVPLGFNEVYEPPFHASAAYLRAANLSNTRLGHGEIDRYLQQQHGGARDGERRYANAAVPGALTVVSRDTFTSAAHVGHNRLRAEAEDLQHAPLSTRSLDIPRATRTPARPLPAGNPELRPDRSVFERPVIHPHRGQPGGRGSAAAAERMPERTPMQQRSPGPAALPAAPAVAAPPVAAPPVRAPASQAEDRPAPHPRGPAPAQRAPAPGGIDRPAAPLSYARPRDQERAPPVRLPQPAAPRDRPGVEDRPAPPRYVSRPEYRAPQPAAPAPSARPAPAERAAPGPPAPRASGREERSPVERHERGNRA